MNYEEFSNFGVLDYVMLVGVLALSLGIGIYTALLGNKTPEEFFTGNRTFKPLPVAISLMTTYISALSILGYSGEVYAYGTQISIIVLGMTLAIVFSMTFVLPVIHPLKLTSITEYIELRFKSNRLRMVISFLICLKSMLYMGVCLYAPTIALATVTGLNNLTYIFLLGVVCTLYSAFGGIRGVIWTDVFQLCVMLAGLLTVNVMGFVQIGGFFKTFYLSAEGGRLDAFNMNPSPFIRHTFFNLVAFGFFFYSYLFTSDQKNVQRMCSVKTLKQAKSALRYNLWGMTFLYFLIISGGLVAYVTYIGCDPMALGIIKKKDEIMPYFIVDKLSFIPGLPGIFVASLIGGTLSTLSSVINAVVAIVWKDVCLKFYFFQSASPRCATLTNKIISLIVGGIMIGLAILSSKAKSLLEVSFIIGGSMQGPIFGVYLIGYFLPRCNIKSVWTGLIISSAFTIWITLGGFYYKKPPPLLPFTADQCENTNFTFNNSSSHLELTSVLNDSIIETETMHSFFIEPLYQISYTLYAVIGPLLCILLAVVVSCLTGNQNIEEISPKYICPHVRKYYWKKQNHESTQENVHKFDTYDISVVGNNVDHNQIINNGVDRLNN